MNVAQAGEKDDAEGEHNRIQKWIEENIRPEELFPLTSLVWPGSLTNGPIMTVTPQMQRPIRIGTCWWPFGAARFARAHYVVSESQLIAIRKVVQKPAGTIQTGILSLADATRTINMPMWMVPAWPLAQAAPGAHGWLLTLVDDRYWWQNETCTLTVNPGVTQWTDLYAQIGTALGITIKADPVAAAYGTPSVFYDGEYSSLPMLLDTVALSCGQRCTRNWATGQVYMQNALMAIASVTAQYATTAPPYAGGRLTLLPNQ